MKTIALLSLVAVSVSAKKHDSGSSSASAPVAAVTAAPVPSSVSQTCATFLGNLDSDSKLQSCLNAINSATGNLNTNSSSSDVTTALGNLCTSSVTSACPDSLFRDQLTNFLSQCKDELTGSSPNTDVQNIYDNLYLTAPFNKAVCSTDSSGNFCLSTLTRQAATPSLLSQAQAFLSILVSLPITKRDSSPFSSDGTYVRPNATTFQAVGLPFLFLNAYTPQSTLCSPCAQAIAEPYLKFEGSIADALGVTDSPLLGGQKPLYDAFTNQCGASFTSGIVANAGANPSGNNITVGGSLSGATTVKVSASGFIAALIGAIFAL